MSSDRIVNTILIAAMALFIAIIAVALRDTCFGGPCPGVPPAQPQPAVTLQAAVLPGNDHVTVATPRRPSKTWSCRDKAAMVLYKAGFTGWSHQMAWAITYRESRHQNLIPGHPQYNGSDLGMWQINRGTWSGSAWWTESAMSDPVRQSRIVYRILSKKGTYWVPWGLNRDGSLNTSHYSMWSSWQHQNWIMAPFREGLAKYPCKTTPPNKKETT